MTDALLTFCVKFLLARTGREEGKHNHIVVLLHMSTPTMVAYALLMHVGLIVTQFVDFQIERRKSGAPGAIPTRDVPRSLVH